MTTTRARTSEPQVSEQAPPSRGLLNALLGLLCLIWGSTWIVIQGGLEDLPPFTSAGARFVIAAVVMALVAAVIGRRERGERPKTWLWLVMGVANFAISYGVVYSCETVLPSAIVAVLWGVYPMLTAAAGHFWLPQERLRGRQWAGFLFGLIGVGLLFLTDLQSLGASAIPAAAVLFISPLVSALGTVIVKRYGGGTSSLLLNRNGMIVGAALLLALAGTFEAEQPAAWTDAAIASVVYLALVGTVLTFGLFFWLMRHLPAYRMSLIAYVTPVIALALGWTLGDEPITLNTVGGTALILVGVAFVVRAKPR